MHDLSTINSINNKSFGAQIANIHNKGHVAVVAYTGLNAVGVFGARDELFAEAIAEHIKTRGIAYRAEILRPN